jgi:uncharacterized protein
MFRIGLGELDRKGGLRLQRAIPADDPLWEGAEFRLRSEVSVDLAATRAASGQVVVHGDLKATIGGVCRRCLEPVEMVMEPPVDLVWSEPDAWSEGGEAEPGDTDGIRRLEPGQSEIDVGEALREELFLSAPRYLLCRPACKGICPQCGVNWNEETCECSGGESDPRWDSLRSLQKD